MFITDHGEGWKLVKEDNTKATNVAGKFSDNGLLIVTGTNIRDIGIWGKDHAETTLKPFFENAASQHYEKLHWTDILALVELAKTKMRNPITQLPGAYHAGANGYIYMHDSEVASLIKEIADANGRKSWNTVIKQRFPKAPFGDKDSPYNTASKYYNASKAVFEYDAENGYIIYQNGEVYWVKTGDHYHDTLNGPPSMYDKPTQTLKYTFGSVLNLKTFVRTDNQVKIVVVPSKPKWYKPIVDTLKDRTRLMYILAGVIALLLVKKKRNG